MKSWPKPIVREQAKLVMLDALFFLVSIFMIIWSFSLQTVLFAALLTGGYTYFLYRRYRKIQSGYDVFDGECIETKQNRIAQAFTSQKFTYRFKNKYSIVVHGRKLAVAKGFRFRFYLPKGTLERVRRGKEDVYEYYGFEYLPDQNEEMEVDSGDKTNS